VALVRGCLSPGTAEAQARDAPCAVSEDFEHFVVHLDYGWPLVGCPARPPMGGEERHASLVATVAGGWHLGRDAGADSRYRRRARHDLLGVWRRGLRFFPLGRGAARASPAEGKAKGF